MSGSSGYLALLLLIAVIFVALAAIYLIWREIKGTRSHSAAASPNPTHRVYGMNRSTAPEAPSAQSIPTPPTAGAAEPPTLAPLAATVTTTQPQAKPTLTPTPNARLIRRAPFSRSEGRFYDFLRELAQDEYLVATKIPLRDLFGRTGILEQGLYSMYDNGHVDFVLLEPTLKTPLLAIELDGTTHNDPKQIDRDRRKQELFQMSDLPLLRFRAGVLWGDKERAEILAALPKRVGS